MALRLNRLDRHFLRLAAFTLICGLTQPVRGQTPSPGDHPPTAADSLLDSLKVAPDEPAAAQIEQELERRWLRAGSPAVTLLMSRGLRLMHAGESNGAVQSFSDAITLQPGVAEAWHQRAVARYQAGDVDGAIRDLEQTIRLQPRAFGAFHALADIAAARQDWKSAYAAWRKLLEIDPKTPGGAERMQELKRRAEGEET